MSAFQEVIESNTSTILTEWLAEMAISTRRSDLMSDNELKEQATELLRLVSDASQESFDVQSSTFLSTRDFLGDVAKTRMEQGFSAAETSMFVLSMKQPIFNALSQKLKSKPEQLISEIWSAGTLIDKLAMLTVSTAVAFREATIQRQQEEMLELSTPAGHINEVSNLGSWPAGA